MKLLLLMLLLWMPAFAQDHEVRIGYAGQDESGATRVFANHYGLSDGFFVELIRLDLGDKVKEGDELRFTASGFGADPSARAGLFWRRPGTWKLVLDYRRKEKEVATAAFASDEETAWSLTRWKAALTYDGMQALRWRLDARYESRTGRLNRPFYGLGLPYAVNRELEESHTLYGLSVETRNLPVKLLLEQQWSTWRREYESLPANGGNALEDDEDQLVSVTTPGEDKNDSPATRLVVNYRKPRFALDLMGFIRRDRLRADRNDTTLYELADDVGQVAFTDDVDGSVDRDTALAALNLAFKATDKLEFRLTGRYRDQAGDTGLDGTRSVDLIGRETTVTISETMEERGFLDLRETDLSAEASWRNKGLNLTLAFFDQERDLSWQRENDGQRYDDTRSADAWRLGASYRPHRQFNLRLGLESGSFGHQIFRVDPRSVDRIWGKMRWKPAEGWSLSLQGSREDAENDTDPGLAERNLDQLGASISYSKPNGMFASLTLNQLDLNTSVQTAFYAPEPETGVSLFESELMTLSGQLIQPFGEDYRLMLRVITYEDSGSSAPLDDRRADLRFEGEASNRFLYALFIQHWSHDFNKGTVEYDVTRYGVSLGWRF
jgi:hypothetical protein